MLCAYILFCHFIDFIWYNQIKSDQNQTLHLIVKTMTLHLIVKTMTLHLIVKTMTLHLIVKTMTLHLIVKTMTLHFIVKTMTSYRVTSSSICHSLYLSLSTRTHIHIHKPRHRQTYTHTFLCKLRIQLVGLYYSNELNDKWTEWLKLMAKQINNILNYLVLNWICKKKKSMKYAILSHVVMTEVVLYE